MGKKEDRWVVAGQRKRIVRQLGRLNPRQALLLQGLNISQAQISQSPENEYYPKYGKEFGKAAQAFKRRGLLSYTNLFFSKERDAYAIIGLKLTPKGMRALSKAGGTVIMPKMGDEK